MTSFEQDRDDLEDALAIDEGLTEWEVSFLDSIAVHVLDEKSELSDKQRAKLQQILESHDA